MAKQTVRTRLSPSEKLAAVRAKQEQALEKARAAVSKAEQTLGQARETLAKLEEEAPHKLRIAELAAEMASHRAAVRAIRTRPAPAAAVTTQDGEVRPLSEAAVETVRKAVGRKRKGTLSPLDGEDVQALLKVLDESGAVGDVFTVALKGRRPVRFEVCEEGLKFVAL